MPSNYAFGQCYFAKLAKKLVAHSTKSLTHLEGDSVDTNGGPSWGTFLPGCYLRFPTSLWFGSLFFLSYILFGSGQCPYPSTPFFFLLLENSSLLCCHGIPYFNASPILLWPQYTCFLDPSFNPLRGSYSLKSFTILSLFDSNCLCINTLIFCWCIAIFRWR